MQGSCLVRPRAGEGATAGSPGPVGTLATPSHGRREDEGAIWVIESPEGLRPQPKGPEMGSQLPFLNPSLWATGS